jgi:hypothetical protein
VGVGERARPGRTGPRPRGPWEAQATVHRLVGADASGSGAGRAGRQPGRLRSPFVSTASLRLSRNEAVGMGDRARPGRSGPRPRGPWEAQATVHRRVGADASESGAGRAGQQPGRLRSPIRFHCLAPAKPERSSGVGGARPPRAQWTAPSRSMGGASNGSPPGGCGRARVRRGACRPAAGAAAIPIRFHCLAPAKPERSSGVGGARPPRAQWTAPSRSTGGETFGWPDRPSPKGGGASSPE